MSLRIFHSFLWSTQSKALVQSINRGKCIFWNSVAFSMIQWMSAIWFLVPLPCLTQWNYEPYLVWPPNTDRSWCRILTKRGSLENGLASHFNILALRTPWKDKKHYYIIQQFYSWISKKKLIRKYMTLMFIAILFTIAKVWKESKCQSTDGCIKMCMHQFIFLPILYEGSLFSIFSPTFVSVLLDGSLWQLWSDISFYFWFAFLWLLAILSILSYACWSFAFPFWKYIYSIFLPIF